MTTIDVELLDDEHETRNDYRRANGAPLVSDPTDSTKTLRYARPSSYGKDLDDESALTFWKIDRAMEGVAYSPALRAKISALKSDDKISRKELRDEAMGKGQANEAADMGTALHAMTARIEDPDDDFEPPEAYIEDLTAYSECLERYGLVSEMTEAPLVNDDFRTAGHADRIFRLTRTLHAPDGIILEPGELLIGDIKTGKKLDFSAPGHTVQLALYATGVLYDVHTERRLPTPPINRRWAILIHLPVGKGRCELLWSSVEIGLLGAQYSQQVREWRKLWKSGFYSTPQIAEPVDVVELAVTELGATVVMNTELVPRMVEYCAARIRAIGQHPEARRWLINRWPPDVPTPKQGLSEPGDVVAVLDALDHIEAQFSLTFPDPDPRLELQQGVHRDKLHREQTWMLTSE